MHASLQNSLYSLSAYIVQLGSNEVSIKSMIRVLVGVEERTWINWGFPSFCSAFGPRYECMTGSSPLLPRDDVLWRWGFVPYLFDSDLLLYDLM